MVADAGAGRELDAALLQGRNAFYPLRPRGDRGPGPDAGFPVRTPASRIAHDRRAPLRTITMRNSSAL